MPTTPITALCGHERCDPWQRRNSVLDEVGDVVLYLACDGSQHLFRDGNANGLLVHWAGNGHWTLTRETHTSTGEGDGEVWSLVPDAEPVCAGGPDGRGGYAARRLPTGRVILRHDTQFGLLAKVARYYLRKER